MAWLDLGPLSAIHVKVALMLLGTVVLYGAMVTSNRVPWRLRAFARVRKVIPPSAE
jgi:hypothetical protein